MMGAPGERFRSVAMVAGVLLLGPLDCKRQPPPAPPEPLPQVPAPFASAAVSPAPDIADLVERVRPAVVNITAVHEVVLRRRGLTPIPIPGIPGGGDQVLKEGSLGSGFIVDYAGHVVTNAHVVADAEVVQVKLADERTLHARVVARDEPLDVAVLEIANPPHDLPAASLGSSARLRVGEFVVAIGNPFGLGDTVTMGIVSAKGRALGAGPYDNFLQTDAPINPGNSGGPLFDLHGQVVGINTAVARQAQGIGFAVPIDVVRRELPQLIATGSVARGRLGVAIEPVEGTGEGDNDAGPGAARGALVVQVDAGGPAARGGVEVGDVIVSVDREDVRHATDLPRLVASHAPGSSVGLTIVRNGHTRRLEVTLGTVQRKPEGAASKQP